MESKAKKKSEKVLGSRNSQLNRKSIKKYKEKLTRTNPLAKRFE